MMPHKILYVPPRGIGDLVFSLPLLHSLRSALIPPAEIEIPIPNRDSLKQMLDLIGFVKPCDVFLPTPSEDPLAKERWEASQSGDSNKKYAIEEKIFEKYLAGKSYDLAIVAKPFKIKSIKTLQVSRKGLEEMGFDWKRAHMVDGFLAFADYMGIPPIKRFDLDFDRNSRARTLGGEEVGIQEPYILFNLGASSNSKKLTSETYSKVSKWLEKKGFNTVLVGTPQEYQDAREIEASGKGVINLVSNDCLTFDLRNYTILASQSKAVIGGDSGLLHLADATGTTVIGVYGPTNPAKVGPYNNLARVVSRYNSDQNITNVNGGELIGKLEEIV